jgi:hypothetical protein
MDYISWKSDLVEVPMRTRKNQEGIELLIHIIRPPKKIISTLDAPHVSYERRAKNEFYKSSIPNTRCILLDVTTNVKEI